MRERTKICANKFQRELVQRIVISFSLLFFSFYENNSQADKTVSHPEENRAILRIFNPKYTAKHSYHFSLDFFVRYGY